ncbi:hypothetical protein AB1283_00715 [Bacillus sp. S13(2024)]|uniref:hypothetical protein n=1 Tax=Bacillus sp. S13(2024) TaxID=3162885 RepID=UPI003D25104A
MTLQEKAQLVKQLTNEIIEEISSEEFSSKSEENKRIASLVKVFKTNVTKHAELLTKWTKNTN